MSMSSFAKKLKDRGWKGTDRNGHMSGVTKGNYRVIMTVRGWVLFKNGMDIGVFHGLASATDTADRMEAICSRRKT